MELSGLPRDLLDAAKSLLNSSEPTEAAIRRAISTAYYALIHLVTAEACNLWGVSSQRGRLARQFDHKRMRDASAEVVRTHLGSRALDSALIHRKSPEAIEISLAVVARAFVLAQQSRHRADYDLTWTPTRAEAQWEIYSAESAFADWVPIREEEAAKDYLFALLFKDRLS
jgi:uncharacterized protein (UPF0332 family)